MTKQAAETGIELIDRDHHIFRSLIDRLQAEINRGIDEASVAERKKELLTFLDGHIEFENRVMRAQGFPIVYTHVEEHEAFRAHVCSVLDEVSGAVAVNAVSKTLKKAHDYHVKHFDAVFCHYLADKYALAIVGEGLGI